MDNGTRLRRLIITTVWLILMATVVYLFFHALAQLPRLEQQAR